MHPYHYKLKHRNMCGEGGAHTPPKNAYPLTIQHIQLKIDIFTSKSGKHEAYHGKHHDYLTIVCTLTTFYHTLTDAYHEAVPKTWGWTHPPKNAYRLPLSIFN